MVSTALLASVLTRQLIFDLFFAVRALSETEFNIPLFELSILFQWIPCYNCIHYPSCSISVWGNTFGIWKLSELILGSVFRKDVTFSSHQGVWWGKWVGME